MLTKQTRCLPITTIILTSFWGLLVAPFAVADIISIDGSETQTSQCGSGSVVCLSGTNPFLLSDVLNGSTPLVIPPNGTPHFLVKDDLPGVQSSLTLVFSGSLASNANIQCQVTGWPSTQGSNTFQSPFGTNNCTVNGSTGTGPNGVTPDTIIWTEGSGGTAGLSQGELFDVRTASFAHAGQDFGHLTGAVPEPSGVSLLALIVIGVVGSLRRKVFPNLFQS
jgi:hypothetical protein